MEEADRERKELFNVAQGLCFSGYAEARAVLLSCLMDPCSPDPLR